MASDILYVPGEDGKMRARGLATPEQIPVLRMEDDTGTIKFDFVQLCLQQKRIPKDVIIQTKEGRLAGVLVLTEAMPPGMIKDLQDRGIIT